MNEERAPLTSKDASMGTDAPTTVTLPVHCAPKKAPCPQCGNSVGARFNFCPNCKCNLHPSCPQCKREIAETDKYCPYCGNDLKAAADAEPAMRSPT